MWKLELFDLDFSTLKKRQAEGPDRSMEDFIKQLRDNFSTRFEDYRMPMDIIAFVRAPLTVRPDGERSSLAKKTIPSLDEAANQTELIEFQTSRQIGCAQECGVLVCVLGSMLRGKH